MSADVIPFPGITPPAEAPDFLADMTRRMERLREDDRVRVAPLTRAEISELRTMLSEFAAIKEHCPMARRLLGGDGE